MVTSSEEVVSYKAIIDEKTNNELREIIEQTDILSTLDKHKLAELIISNNDALELLELEARRDSLKKMTNQEIRSLLKGVEGVSRLKKSKLVEKVLIQDKLKSINRN